MSPFPFLRRFGLVILIAGLIAAFLATGAWRLISFHQLRLHHAELEAFVHQYGALSVVLFFCVFVLVVTACIPGPGLMCTVSGYLFGWIAGGFIALAACATGSVVVFLACRSAFAEAVVRRSGPRVRRLEHELRSNAFSYLLALKLMPILPFFVPNIAAGLAGVRLRAVILASLIGSAPVCFILASLGAGLGHMLDNGQRPHLRLFERPDVFLPLIALTLLSVASIAWRLIRRRRSLPTPFR
ncbi:MAG: TVP38/TMEM64 family protein [Caulobacteraceae bacterium]